MVAPILSRMRMATRKKEWVTQVFFSTMHMVFSKSKKLMDSVSLELEIHGVKENGQESSLMKMKLGTIIKVSRKNLTMSSKMTETGG